MGESLKYHVHLLSTSTSLTTLVQHIQDKMDVARLVDIVESELGPDASVALVEEIAAAIILRDHNRADSKRSDAQYQSLIDSNGPRHRNSVELTLHVSVGDCGSNLPGTVRARVYDKIRRLASRHLDTAADVSIDFGYKLTGAWIAVTPTSQLGPITSVTEHVQLARILESAATDIGADAIRGFATDSEAIASPSGVAFMEAIPHVLGSTNRVLVSVSCGRDEKSICFDTICTLAEAIRKTADRSSETDPLACLRLGATIGAHDCAGRNSASGATGTESLPYCPACNATVCICLNRASPDSPLASKPARQDATISLRIAGAKQLLDDVASRHANAGVREISGAIAADISDLIREGSLAADQYARLLTKRSGFSIGPGSVEASYSTSNSTSDASHQSRQSRREPVHFDQCRVIPLAGEATEQEIATALIESLMDSGRPGTNVCILPVAGKAAGDLVAFGDSIGSHQVQAF